MAIGLPWLAAAGPACNVAAAPSVPVIKGLSYDEARASLLAAGWLPGHGSQFSEIDGNQVAFHDRGYTELKSCGLGQGTPCHFAFTAKGAFVLNVTTQGEENPVLESKAVVVAAELGCEN